jgi:hypothetical protein
MYCYCGKEIASITNNTFAWQRCTYNAKGEIIYAICMHGIVCIDADGKDIYLINVLEDLKISVQNEVVGFEPCGREKDRIEALEKAIEILKEKIK